MRSPGGTSQSAEQRVLRLRPTSFEEQRGARHLLVWGDVGEWMIVDDELRAFLTLLDGSRTDSKAAAAHGRRWSKAAAAVAAETEPLLADLAQRHLLDEEAVERPPERLSISNVTVNLTNRCNLSCSFCYNRRQDTHEIAPELLMNALAEGQAVLAPDASLILLGGEPCLAFDRLLAILDRAPEIFRRPTLISTNGTLMTDEMAHALARRNVEVQVSIDSATPERHDELRGAGTFAKATETVRRLARAGARTIISSVLGLDSLGNVEATLTLARELGAAEARFIPLRIVGAATGLRMSRPDLALVLDRLVEVLRRNPGLRALLGRDFFSLAAKVASHSRGRTNCGIGRRVLFVDADGTVYPCPNHVRPEYRCGNLLRDRLAPILVDSPVMRLMRQRYQVDNFPECRACAFRYWCAGDCRGEVLATTGDPLARAAYCQDLQRCFTEMFWLMAGHDGPRPAPW